MRWSAAAASGGLASSGSRCAPAMRARAQVYAAPRLRRGRPAPRLLPGRQGAARGRDRDEPGAAARAERMAWTERQRAMLQEMGIRLWATVRAGADRPRRQPAEAPDARGRRCAATRCRGRRSRPARRRRAQRRHRHDALAGAARGGGGLHGLRAVPVAPADGVRRRPPARALDDRRRGAGRAGGPDRASPSSARPASCSTTCCARSS